MIASSNFALTALRDSVYSLIFAEVLEFCTPAKNTFKRKKKKTTSNIHLSQGTLIYLVNTCAEALLNHLLSCIYQLSDQ